MARTVVTVEFDEEPSQEARRTPGRQAWLVTRLGPLVPAAAAALPASLAHVVVTGGLHGTPLTWVVLSLAAAWTSWALTRWAMPWAPTGYVRRAAVTAVAAATYLISSAWLVEVVGARPGATAALTGGLALTLVLTAAGGLVPRSGHRAMRAARAGVLSVVVLALVGAFALTSPQRYAVVATVTSAGSSSIKDRPGTSATVVQLAVAGAQPVVVQFEAGRAEAELPWGTKLERVRVAFEVVCSGEDGGRTIELSVPQETINALRTTSPADTTLRVALGALYGVWVAPGTTPVEIEMRSTDAPLAVPAPGDHSATRCVPAADAALPVEDLEPQEDGYADF